MTWRGNVVRERLSAGSKSEHQAIVLVTEAGERFKLRRRGGNPFQDPTLDPLEGKRIECEGILRGYQIIMTRWKVLD